MKYAVIENFFDNFDKIKDEFKKIERYPNNKHPNLSDPKQNPEGLDKFHWDGFRSKNLSEMPFFSLLFLKTFNEKFSYFLPEPCYYILYTHLRLKEHTEHIHQDYPNDDYSMLVYLSPTNLKSSTRLYNDNKEMIDEVKCVQNRALIFDSKYYHTAYGSYGTNIDDGRLTLNAFWRRQSRQ